MKNIDPKLQKKLSRACAQLMIKHPFFGSLVYQHELEFTDVIDTAAATPDGRMMFNPNFVEEVTPGQLMFLIAHEVMHIVFAHAVRRGNRDPETYNIACDAVINEILVSEQVGEFIEGGIRIKGAENETSENIYNKLMSSKKPGNPNGQGADGGTGKSKSQGSQGTSGSSKGKRKQCGYQGTLTIKDLPKDAPQKTDAEVKAAIAEGKIKMGQASAMARMQGKMSGSLGRIVSKLLESRVPWHQLLERYMVAKSEQNYNWSRPDRRRMGIAYMPSRDKYPRMGEVVIGIDVSGSVSDAEIAQYLGHCKAIFEQCRPSKIYVVYCTSQVEAVDEFDSCDEMEPRANMWCGGTYMPAIMEWIDRNDIDADVCVTFTDGYTAYPKDNQVPCDLVWVLSTDYKPTTNPHGEVLYAVEEGNQF